MDYHQTVFDGGEVQLDGNSFDGCTFKDTVIAYDGGPVAIVGCTFTGSGEWRFGGDLATGLEMLGRLFLGDHEQGLRLVSRAMFARAMAAPQVEMAGRAT